MPLTRFLLWSGLGTVIWTGGLAIGGYLLGGQHDRISTWMDPVSYGVIGILVLIYLYRLATFDPEPEKGSD